MGCQTALLTVAMMVHTPLALAVRPSLFSFDTVPVFFHSANESGAWSKAAATRIAKFSMATFEKNMAYGAGGWSEANGPAACRQIKAINPKVATVYYLNSVIDWPFYSLHQQMVAHPEWRLKGENGDDMLVVGQYGLNVSVPAMRQAWMDDCMAATEAGCDGCFIDRSNNMTQLNNSKGGMMSPEQSAQFAAAHLATLTELNRNLAKQGKFAISNNEGSPSLGTTTMMIEDFAASEHCIQTMMQAVSNNLTVQAHAGDLADEPGEDGAPPKVSNCANGITNSLAAFLIAAGPYSYYHCASGWQSPAGWPDVHDDWLEWYVHVYCTMSSN